MRSDIVKKGATRCAHRSLFHANGYGVDELNRPLIGVCNFFKPRPQSWELLRQAVRQSNFPLSACVTALQWVIRA